MHYIVTLVLFAAVPGCNRSAKHYVNRGDALFAARNHEEAEISYRKAISRDSRSGEAQYGLALIRLEQQDVSGAYAGLRKAAELLPTRADIQAKYGDIALRLFTATGRSVVALHEEAEKATAGLLKRDANSPDGLRLRGYLDILALKPDSAIHSFRKSLAVRPDLPDVKLALVQAHFQNQQFGEGEKVAVACIQAHPTFWPAYEYLYEYYMSQSRRADAEALLSQLVASLPKDLQPRLRLAAHHAAAKNQTASDAVLRGIVADSAFSDAHLEVGDFYRRAGRAKEALEQYELGARSSTPRKPEYLRRIAETHWATGNIEQAIKSADAAVAADGADKAATILKSQMLLATGKPDSLREAVEKLQAIVDKNPDNIPARQQLASGYVGSGKLPEARAQLAEVVRRRPGDIGSLVALGVVHQSMDQHEETVRYASEALKYDRTHAPARLLLAAGLIGAGRPAEARADLAALVREQPAFGAAALQLAQLSTHEKRYREADALLQKLYRPGTSDVRVVRAVAGLYASQKQFDRAAKMLEQEIRQRPNVPQLRAMLATIDATAGRYDKAIATLQATTAQGGASPELYLQLTALHRQKKNLPAAAAAVEQATRAFPKDIRLAREAAIVYELQQDRAKALMAHRRIMELPPNDAEAKNNVAYSLAESGGDLNEALRLAEAAVKQKPQSSAYADTMAWIHLKRGDKTTAIQMLQTLAKRHPEDPRYREHLNVALARNP